MEQMARGKIAAIDLTTQHVNSETDLWRAKHVVDVIFTDSEEDGSCGILDPLFPPLSAAETSGYELPF